MIVGNDKNYLSCRKLKRTYSFSNTDYEKNSRVSLVLYYRKPIFLKFNKYKIVNGLSKTVEKTKIAWQQRINLVLKTSNFT